MALVNQIYNIVNDAVKDALGKSATTTKIETTDVVSLGKAISSMDAYEGFYKSLVNRIVKTVYFVRTYEGSNRSVLRDEHEYGAFIQKVYYDMPNAVENATYSVAQGTSPETYKQTSPYDVETVVTVSSLIFGNQGTWTIEIIRPEEQLKSAFLTEANMMSFIDGIYLTVENAFKLEEERLVALAVNTSMAYSINSGKARNLLAEYNTAHASATLTVDECLENADFLKYASKEINRCIENMGKMSTTFNAKGYNTFTSRDNLVVEMLSEFASATDMYLQADTFHNELTKLPKYEKVPFWQNSGSDWSFAQCSEINIEHDDLVTGENADGIVNQSGIICFLHDIENVACYFGNRKTWEMYNPRSEVMVHGEKARKGYAVDPNANAYVFYIAESV
jgi:hypothetical protein